MAVPRSCEICHGPIGYGEPVVGYGDGMAHKFTVTCDWHKDRTAEFERTCGVKIDSDPE